MEKLCGVFVPIELTEQEKLQQVERDRKDKELSYMRQLAKQEALNKFNHLIYQGYKSSRYNSRLFEWNKNIEDCVMQVCNDIEREIDCDARLNPTETLAVAIGVGYYLKEIGYELKS